MHDKKTYLDFFLENNSPKRKKKYFLKKQEEAIIKYNNSTSQAEKNKLFSEIIDECFRDTVTGVMEMKKFRHLPKGLDRQELTELTYFRLVDKIYKFEEGMKSPKTGEKTKAFSYFSTIAKNYILEQIKKHNKVLANKADVESSIDLTILSEDTLSKISKVNVFDEISNGDYVTNFYLSKKIIIDIIKNLIESEEAKEKRDEDFIKLGYCLKYLLEKWGKIEFEKKNEFMRILTLYTGFPQQKVSFLFKTFKLEVLKKTKPNLINKKRKEKIKVEKEEEEEYVDDYHEVEEEENDDNDFQLLSEDETEEMRIMKYDIYSFDEFEAREYKLNNIKFREEWTKKKDSK